jgi:hypothetical protein
MSTTFLPLHINWSIPHNAGFDVAVLKKPVVCFCGLASSRTLQRVHEEDVVLRCVWCASLPTRMNTLKWIGSELFFLELPVGGISCKCDM